MWEAGELNFGAMAAIQSMTTSDKLHGGHCGDHDTAADRHQLARLVQN